VFGRGTLPPHVYAPVLDAARATAAHEKFFHWPFEFPEVFLAGERWGFDAVIGNPPWEMLRGDRGDAGTRKAAHDSASLMTDFARSSGIYSLQGDGHANLYQLFLERMLSLVRPRGRLGLILPSGLATDHGAALLRRHLFERTEVDALITLENRDGIFPIHRGLKFLLLTATKGGRTSGLPCRFGLRRPEILDRLPETGPDPDAVVLPRALLERTGRDALAIPDVRSREDVEILSHIAFTLPALGDAHGWHLAFGRELNATDDRRHFVRAPTRGALPIIEGKQVTPFAVDVERARFSIPRAVAGELLDPARTFERPRLAYRDVAAATNRLTLIAAIVPAGTVTTHTLFCSKRPLEEDCLRFLCGMFNSFVANYFVRMHVGTHVTAAIVSRLPMPRPARGSHEFTEVATLVQKLITTPCDVAAHARLQGAAARAYKLSAAQFRRVLETFPLVPQSELSAAMLAFEI
jgi:Eco57I restriction-modification methylase